MSDDTVIPAHPDSASEGASPAPLRGRSRVAAALAGAVASSAGIVGVFVPETNSGGVPILLVLGGVFTYLAISGQRLTRLKLGANEAELSMVFGAIAGSVLMNPDVPETTKREVAEALDEVRPELPIRTRRVVSAALNARVTAQRYTAAVGRALQQVFPEEFIGDLGIGEADIVLSTEGRSITVRPIYSGAGPLPMAELSDFVVKSSTFAAGAAGGLIVTNNLHSDVAAAVANPEGDWGNFEVVEWNGPGDNDNLRNALIRLLGDRA